MNCSEKGFESRHFHLKKSRWQLGLNLRSLLIENTFVVLVNDIGPGVFETARNETMVFVVRKGQSSESKSTKVVVSNAKQFPAPSKEFSVKQKTWIKNKNAAWLVNVSNEEMQIISKLEAVKYHFGDLCTINQGLRTGNNDKYVKDKKLGALWKPAAGGKHVGRYEPLAEEIFVYYEPKVLDAPRRLELFISPEKLVVQEIRNITLPRRIIATYDNEQFFCLQSTNVINLRKTQDSNLRLKYLLGILNSNCANYFFKQRFSGNNHIASNQLAQFLFLIAIKRVTIKWFRWSSACWNCTASAPSDASRHLPHFQKENGGGRVGADLGIAKQTAGRVGLGRTPQEQEMVKREIKSTDREIDELVYESYGLSEEEKKIVEGG